MPQYKIYAVEPMNYPTVPVIVTTAFRNAGDYPKAEWFLAIPDGATFFAQRIRFNVTEFPAGPFLLDEGLMLREALEEASLKLRCFLSERPEANGQLNGFRSPDLHEDNKNLFVHYWIRGQCLEQLERIARTTEYEPLRVDLDHVLALPRLSRTDL